LGWSVRGPYPKVSRATRPYGRSRPVARYDASFTGSLPVSSPYGPVKVAPGVLPTQFADDTRSSTALGTTARCALSATFFSLTDYAPRGRRFTGAIATNAMWERHCRHTLRSLGAPSALLHQSSPVPRTHCAHNTPTMCIAPTSHLTLGAVAAGTCQRQHAERRDEASTGPGTLSPVHTSPCASHPHPTSRWAPLPRAHANGNMRNAGLRPPQALGRSHTCTQYNVHRTHLTLGAVAAGTHDTFANRAGGPADSLLFAH
jgi:hypothetical protein